MARAPQALPSTLGSAQPSLWACLWPQPKLHLSPETSPGSSLPPSCLKGVGDLQESFQRAYCANLSWPCCVSAFSPQIPSPPPPSSFFPPPQPFSHLSSPPPPPWPSPPSSSQPFPSLLPSSLAFLPTSPPLFPDPSSTFLSKAHSPHSPPLLPPPSLSPIPLVNFASWYLNLHSFPGSAEALIPIISPSSLQTDNSGQSDCLLSPLI